ncbi:MAG TPA: glycosyltransferase [bacterium]|nr:glycosyltransferase [bacterium]
MQWVSEPDNGMYEAINKGFKMSKGQILAYLNSDDLYFPWTVSIVVDYFQKHPQSDLVYGDKLNYDIPSNQIQLCFYPPFRLSWLRRTGFLAQPTVFLEDMF